MAKRCGKRLLVDIHSAQQNSLQLAQAADGMRDPHVGRRILALGIEPAGIQAGIDTASYIRGQGITDDQRVPRRKIGDGGGYLIEKSLFGLSTTHLL